MASVAPSNPPPGPTNVGLVITKRHHQAAHPARLHRHRPSARHADMIDDASGWLCAGKLAQTETVVDGLNKAPVAFINLLRGANTGKMIVRR
jgi:NADPH-dependent curcumin reductase CurA